MDIPDQILIIQNPDGSVQIGTQPHLKNKRVMDCYQCRSKIVFEKQYNTIKCSKCQAPNMVPGSQQQQAVPCIVCGSPTSILRQVDIVMAQCLNPRCGAIAGLR